MTNANKVRQVGALAFGLAACVSAAHAQPVVKPTPKAKITAPSTQAAQRVWLQDQLAIVDKRTKPLSKRYDYTKAPKTLCARASAAEVGWAKTYCRSWGGWPYLDWEENNSMFGAAHQALSTALYVIKRRPLRPQEMDVYAWGSNDVTEMKMLDAAKPLCDAEKWDKCFGAKADESKYEKSHSCNFSKFSRYVAFTSVSEYGDKVVKLHTSPAIAAATCSGR